MIRQIGSYIVPIANNQHFHIYVYIYIIVGGGRFLGIKSKGEVKCVHRWCGYRVSPPP